jgi:hypothetical protein
MEQRSETGGGVVNDIDNIIANLTVSQREALISAPSTPLGNVWLACRGSTKSALVAKGLASGHGDWCTLTERGRAVKAALGGDQA